MVGAAAENSESVCAQSCPFWNPERTVKHASNKGERAERRYLKKKFRNLKNGSKKAQHQINKNARRGQSKRSRENHWQSNSRCTAPSEETRCPKGVSVGSLWPAAPRRGASTEVSELQGPRVYLASSVGFCSGHSRGKTRRT